MKCSALKRKASKIKQQDLTKYQKKRNLLVKLNRETKINYFNNQRHQKIGNLFPINVDLYFSNKHVHGDSRVNLIEKDEITKNKNEIVEKETLLVNNDEIARTFNRDFAETVEKISTFEWPSKNEDLTKETLTKIIKKFIIKKFKNHPSTVKIKNNT